MRKIFKYPLESHGECAVDVPWPAHFVHVGVDPAGRNCVWLEIDPDQEDSAIKIRRIYRVVFTGEEWDGDRYCHLGTWVNGNLVCHLLFDDS